MVISNTSAGFDRLQSVVKILLAKTSADRYNQRQGLISRLKRQHTSVFRVTLAYNTGRAIHNWPIQRKGGESLKKDLNPGIIAAVVVCVLVVVGFFLYRASNYKP